MSAIIIFGASLMAIVFFLLSIFLKGLLALVFGIGNYIKTMVVTAFGTGVAVSLLYFIYLITEGVIRHDILGIVIVVLLLIVEIAVVLVVISFVGRTIGHTVVEVITFLLEKLTWILNKASRWCQKAYDFFIGSIVQRLQKI